MSRSLFGDDVECLVCGTTQNLHRHHVFYGVGRRMISEREGCWAYLCARHHNMSKEGVHFNKELDLRIKQACQIKWMERYNTDIDDFRATFHCGSYV